MKDMSHIDRESGCSACYLIHEIEGVGPDIVWRAGDPLPSMLVRVVTCDCACHLNPVRKVRRK